MNLVPFAQCANMKKRHLDPPSSKSASLSIIRPSNKTTSSFDARSLVLGYLWRNRESRNEVKSGSLQGADSSSYGGRLCEGIVITAVSPSDSHALELLTDTQLNHHALHGNANGSVRGSIHLESQAHSAASLLIDHPRPHQAHESAFACVPSTSQWSSSSDQSNSRVRQWQRLHTKGRHVRNRAAHLTHSIGKCCSAAEILCLLKQHISLASSIHATAAFVRLARLHKHDLNHTPQKSITFQKSSNESLIQLLYDLIEQSGDPPTHGSDLGIREAVNMIWSMASLRLNVNPRIRDHLLATLTFSMASANTQELCNSVYAIAKLGWFPCKDWMAQFRVRSSCLLSLFSGRELAMLMWAEASLSKSRNINVKDIQGDMGTRAWMLELLGAQQICMEKSLATGRPCMHADDLGASIWAVSELCSKSHPPPPLWTSSFSELTLTQISSFRGDQLGLMLWSISEGYSGPAEASMLKLFQESTAYFMQLAEQGKVKVRHLAMASSAITKFESLPAPGHLVCRMMQSMCRNIPMSTSSNSPSSFLTMAASCPSSQSLTSYQSARDAEPSDETMMAILNLQQSQQRTIPLNLELREVEVLLASIIRLGDREANPSSDICSWALALIEHAAREKMRQAMVQVHDKKQSEATLHETLRLLWACQKLRLSVPKVLQDAIENITVKQRWEVLPHDMASLLCTMGNLRACPSQAWLEEALLSIKRKEPLYSLTDLAKVAWGVAHIGYRPREEWVEWLVRQLQSRLSKHTSLSSEDVSRKGYGQELKCEHRGGLEELEETDHLQGAPLEDRVLLNQLRGAPHIDEALLLLSSLPLLLARPVSSSAVELLEDLANDHLTPLVQQGLLLPRQEVAALRAVAYLCKEHELTSEPRQSRARKGQRPGGEASGIQHGISPVNKLEVTSKKAALIERSSALHLVVTRRTTAELLSASLRSITAGRYSPGQLSLVSFSVAMLLRLGRGRPGGKGASASSSSPDGPWVRALLQASVAVVPLMSDSQIAVLLRSVGGMAGAGMRQQKPEPRDLLALVQELDMRAVHLGPKDILSALLGLSSLEWAELEQEHGWEPSLVPKVVAASAPALQSLTPAMLSMAYTAAVNLHPELAEHWGHNFEALFEHSRLCSLGVRSTDINASPYRQRNL